MADKFDFHIRLSAGDFGCLKGLVSYTLDKVARAGNHPEFQQQLERLDQTIATSESDWRSKHLSR